MRIALIFLAFSVAACGPVEAPAAPSRHLYDCSQSVICSNPANNHSGWVARACELSEDDAEAIMYQRACDTDCSCSYHCKQVADRC